MVGGWICFAPDLMERTDQREEEGEVRGWMHFVDHAIVVFRVSFRNSNFAPMGDRDGEGVSGLCYE